MLLAQCAETLVSVVVSKLAKRVDSSDRLAYTRQLVELEGSAHLELKLGGVLDIRIVLLAQPNPELLMQVFSEINPVHDIFTEEWMLLCVVGV